MKNKFPTEYGYYPLEKAYYKSIPGEGTYLKFEGGKEFKAEVNVNNVLAEAMIRGEKITKEEYDKA